MVNMNIKKTVSLFLDRCEKDGFEDKKLKITREVEDQWRTNYAAFLMEPVSKKLSQKDKSSLYELFASELKNMFKDDLDVRVYFYQECFEYEICKKMKGWG
jgi:hypothetical protein